MPDERTPPASSPSPPRRAPRRKPATSGTTAARKIDGTERTSDTAGSQVAPRPGARDSLRARDSEGDAGSRLRVEGEPEERTFDELVDYRTAVQELDRLASRNPRLTVLGAIAVGFLIGFGVGLLAAKD